MLSNEEKESINRSDAKMVFLHQRRAGCGFGVYSYQDGGTSLQLQNPKTPKMKVLHAIWELEKWQTFVSGPVNLAATLVCPHCLRFKNSASGSPYNYNLRSR